MREIVNDFILETEELLSGLDQDLVEMEKSPDDLNLLNKIFRSVHTIKGAAGFLGFSQMVELVHHAEDVLNKLRHGELKVNSKINDAILKSVDIIKLLLTDIKNNDIKDIDLSGILSELTDILSGKMSEAPAGKEPAPKKLGEILVEEQVVTEEQLEEALESQVPPKLGEVLVEKKFATEDQVQKALSKQGAAAQPPEQTIRVDINRLDNVMNLVGEMVLGRNRLLQLVSKLEQQYEDSEIIGTLNETASHITLITTDLQLAVMKTRMQPIKKVFSKFPRMVRDMSRDLGKEINLELIGEETELDKSVIEEIGDPLVHLVRNSIDHGIEMPDERISAGKDKVGQVRLSAYYEGNNIVIEIKDDGKGMDVDRIKEKAVEKGMITPEEASRMSKKDVISFIFAPGFSTAKKVTDVSGRGVGMDVVKTNITKLNGLIDIDSDYGKGSVISIKLPLTIAIMQSLMVGTGNEIFALPLASVIETVRISNDDIQTVDRHEVIKLRNSVLPLVRLGDIFRISAENSKNGWLYVVVTGVAEKRVGIMVEKLYGQEEVVIKSLGEYVSPKGIAGATILGDGRVTLIVDLAQLFEIINTDKGKDARFKMT
ncbi:MAG: chemotaxis protein CheA [Nitrospinae bacterium]|nr:chemotaxis protein CheA [Nitrospinota bacterium]